MPFLLFGCLLYNELIIIYVWGLNSNTSKEVIKRANEEQSQFESIEAKLIVKGVEEGPKEDDEPDNEPKEN